MNQNKTEWVIHVWGKKRDTLELNDVEKFHLDMLKLFQNQQKKFDRILFNIALDDINDLDLFNFLKGEIGKVMVNKNVEFKYCQNDVNKGEYVTFRPYVFDRIGEDVDVLYTHFKGYKSFIQIFKESFPIRVIDLSEMFWSYIMYRYLLNMGDVNEHLRDNSMYCWFILKDSIDNPYLTYYKNYQDMLKKNDERLVTATADDLCKHSPGSFAWYNLKKIGESLKDKPEVRDITTDYLMESSKGCTSNLCTHFCEVYLMQFLKEEECYSAKDFNKEVKDIAGPLYVQLYPSKKIAKEFLKDFEKYLIEKGLI